MIHSELLTAHEAIVCCVVIGKAREPNLAICSQGQSLLHFFTRSRKRTVAHIIGNEAHLLDLSSKWDILI